MPLPQAGTQMVLTITQAGQFQVSIGNTVSDFYNDLAAVSGVATSTTASAISAGGIPGTSGPSS